ncbi:MAG: hypothetical protein WA667_16605 [Candidatus Nitrosopolaris sp.]
MDRTLSELTSVICSRPKYTDSGPLSGLITELEFNHRCSKLFDSRFEIALFRRAISDGILSLLNEELSNMIMDTCAKLNLANQGILRLQRMLESSVEYKYKRPSVYRQAECLIEETLGKLKAFVVFTDK